MFGVSSNQSFILAERRNEQSIRELEIRHRPLGDWYDSGGGYRHLNTTRIVQIVAIVFSIASAGCSSAEHHTEVTLPNGITCKSETSGTFMQRTRSLICTDSNGKVIGSYKSD